MARAWKRHVGFYNVVWAGLEIDLCRDLSWSVELSSVWDLVDDDELAVQSSVSGVLSGEITLAGRNIDLVLPAYLGRTADMTLTVVNADAGDARESGDTLTLKDAHLTGIGNGVPTSNYAERTLTFKHGRVTGGKDIYAFT